MFRSPDPTGIAMALGTHVLILFGNWATNRLVIEFWFQESNYAKQAIPGIPLTPYGLIHSIVFNSLCILAMVSHLRASFADPGEIPEAIEVPDYVDTALLNNCEKCGMRWKPMRAHHCSSCGRCIFKVS